MSSTEAILHSFGMVFTAFPLDRLPNEIIHIVFENLAQRHIGSLRLVCKRFAAIGSGYILTEAHLFCKSSQFEQLRQISEHPIISRKVDSLFYEADTLDDYGSIQNWRQHVCVPRWMHDLALEGIIPPSPTASEREKRRFRRELIKAINGSGFRNGDMLLRESYDRYVKYLADQESLRAQDYNVGMLKGIMAKMPNLKIIEMSTESCLNNGRSARMERSFKDGLVVPYGDRQVDEGCGVGQLRSLLLAADAAGLKLETLSAGSVDWRFFRESGKQDIQTLRKMQRAVRHLRNLTLYISTSSEYDEDYIVGPVSHFMVPACAEYLRQSSNLKDFVTATPDLERLDFNFDCYEPFPPATLCDSVGTFKWHSLRVVGLAFISANEDCLAQFFDRHASSLRKIRLDTMLLTTGSWASLLQRARKILKLEQAALFGTLKGTDLDETHLLDLPPGLNGGRRAKIQVQIEKYLLKGGDGPLLDLNALVLQYYHTYVRPDEELSPYVDIESDEVIMDRF